MTVPPLISGPHQLPGVDGMRSRASWSKLAKKLAPASPDTAKVGIRQGVVTGVTSVTPGQTPTYTVAVGGSQVLATCIGTCGPLAGDIVMIIRQGPDWMILGLAPSSAGLKTFTPTWLGSTTNPVVSSAVGKFRMVGPTTIWVHIDLTTSSIGSGSYSVGGLPLSAQFDQALDFLFQSNNNSRWATVGYIAVATNNRQFLRLGCNGGVGIGSTSPLNPPTQPLRLTGTGTLEVDPSGL